MWSLGSWRSPWNGPMVGAAWVAMRVMHVLSWGPHTWHMDTSHVYAHRGSIITPHEAHVSKHEPEHARHAHTLKLSNTAHPHGILHCMAAGLD